MNWATSNIIEIIDNCEPDYLFAVRLAADSWELAKVMQHPVNSGNLNRQAVMNMIPKLRQRFEFRQGISWEIVADYYLQDINGYSPLDSYT